MTKKSASSSTIALNKKAGFEYFIEQRFEAGLQLEGWEVKACRAGRAQITETYIYFKDGEAFVVNMQLQPLSTTSTHTKPNPTRSRKLLLHRKEINKLMVAKERQGYTIVATALYWKHNVVKLEIALAKGKKLHDKRATDKERDWKREQGRIMKKGG